LKAPTPIECSRRPLEFKISSCKFRFLSLKNKVGMSVDEPVMGRWKDVLKT
jgi:hypothetical protein